jgi:hypothetical protein
MITRNTVTRALLMVYALGSIAVALPLLLDSPGAGDLTATTSDKILAAAILAMGFGAAMASRDTWQHRLMIQVVMLFSVLTALAVVYRILVHHDFNGVDATWMVLALAVAVPLLLAVFYPRPPQD